jgi:hypothetical protein
VQGNVLLFSQRWIADSLLIASLTNSRTVSQRYRCRANRRHRPAGAEFSRRAYKLTSSLGSVTALRT